MSHNIILEKLAHWAWGGVHTPSSSPEIITPSYCLSTLPLLPIPCLSPLITKLIGIAIIIGATLNKAPVVFNVLATSSVTGLAVGGVYGEVLMYSNAAFYGILRNNPFTAWGENGIMTLQSWFVCFLLWRYKDDPPFGTWQKVVAGGMYAFYVFVAFVVLPEEWYYLLPAANWPTLVVARGSQIVDTFRLKHTGNHSLITTGMNLLGTVIRIFTTIKEIGWDFALLSGYLLSAVLNTVLVLQFFLYWDATVRFKKSLKDKKKE